jgi:hypothetical protein
MTPQQFVDLLDALERAKDSLPQEAQGPLQDLISTLRAWAQAQGIAFIDGVIDTIKNRALEDQIEAQKTKQRLEKIIVLLEELKKKLERVPAH